MINNLKSIPGDKYAAGQAVRYLSMIKRLTGQSEQSILVSMVLYSFNNNPDYKEIRSSFSQEGAPEEKAKKCLSYLRATLGIKEQSLLCSMVHFAVKNDPAYAQIRNKS